MQLKEVYAPSVAQALWADLPLINIAFIAWCLTHIELNSLPEHRGDLALTCIFPLCLVLVVYLLRWGSAAPSERVVGVLVVLGAVGAIVFDATVLAAVPRPIDLARLRHVCEVGTLCNCALLIVHCWTRGGWPRVLLFLGPVALYGALWANFCVVGGFVTELGERWYVPFVPAPLAGMVGWVVMFYVVTWISWTLRHSIGALRRSAFASAIIAAGAAVLLQLQIEPLAVVLGLWRWHGSLMLGPMGTPQLAFLIWICAVIPLEMALFLRESAEHLLPGGVALLRHRRWLWARLPAVLMVALVLFFGLVMLCEGTRGPSLDILRRTVLGHLSS